MYIYLYYNFFHFYFIQSFSITSVKYSKLHKKLMFEDGETLCNRNIFSFVYYVNYLRMILLKSRIITPYPNKSLQHSPFFRKRVKIIYCDRYILPITIPKVIQNLPFTHFVWSSIFKEILENWVYVLKRIFYIFN